MNLASKLMFLAATVLAGCGTKTDDDALVCDDTDFFSEDRVLEVAITMDEADWDSLRHESRSIAGEFAGDCRNGPMKGDYTYFPASIDIDGEAASDIGIRKKGFIGSQSTEKPGFRINLDEYVDDTELFCTDNITLNNSVQDPALIRQCLTYKAFRDAGIAAPRCNFARVSMNGSDLGIYVNIEPVKKKFLRQNFGNDEGDLYEGTITDFPHNWLSTFDPKTDATDSELGPIRAVADDFQDGTDSLETILRRHFDYDQLLTFLAMEAWTGHWDGYGGNQNNFFVHKSTETGKLSFIPWGADGTMSPEQVDEEDGWFPTSGYLVKRILQDEDLADAWYDRIGELRGRGWDAEGLLAEAERLKDLLSTEVDAAVLEEHLWGVTHFIERREDSLKSLMPVTAIEEFENPFCMVDQGFVDIDFSTEWTAEDPDLGAILEYGGADMELTWDGYEIPVEAQGAYAGPLEDGYGQLLFPAAFEGDNGPAYVLPVVYFEREALTDGSELSLDWGEGSVLYMDVTTGWEFINIGELWDGSVRIDTASPVSGAEVTGTLSAGIYGWQEVGG